MTPTERRWMVPRSTRVRAATRTTLAAHLSLSPGGAGGHSMCCFKLTPAVRSDTKCPGGAKEEFSSGVGW